MSVEERNEYVTQLSQKEIELQELKNNSKTELSNIFGEVSMLGDYQEQIDQNPVLKDFLQGTLHKNIDGFCNIMEKCVKNTQV